MCGDNPLLNEEDNWGDEDIDDLGFSNPEGEI